MKTYKIEISSEPLREGCLTNKGVVYMISDTPTGPCYTTNYGYSDYFGLKHLICIDITDCAWPPGDEDFWKLITDPAELQKIWEAIRGEEPKQLLRCNKCIGMNSSDCSTCYGSSEVVNTNYYGNLNEWQNFTLKEGTYQVEETTFNTVSHRFNTDAKVLPDNNGWIRFEDDLPRENEWVILGNDVDQWTDRGKLLDDGRFVNGECQIWPTHWQPLPQPPRH